MVHRCIRILELLSERLVSIGFTAGKNSSSYRNRVVITPIVLAAIGFAVWQVRFSLEMCVAADGVRKRFLLLLWADIVVRG